MDLWRWKGQALPVLNPDDSRFKQRAKEECKLASFRDLHLLPCPRLKMMATHVLLFSSEKTVQDVKKMWHNTGLKARQDEDLCCGTQFPSNQMKKIPLTRPRSPKLGRKSTSSKVMDSSRPSPNTKSPKCVVEKNKQNSNRSVTSRSQKNAHENASPNIQS